MNSESKLRSELERLTRLMQRLQDRRDLASGAAAAGAGAELAELDSEIAQVELQANSILARLAEISEGKARLEEAFSEEQRKRRLEEPPYYETRAATRAVRQRRFAPKKELALMLALAESKDAALVQKFKGVSKEMYSEFEQRFPRLPPLTDEMQTSLFESLPSEARVLDLLFRRGTDLTANNYAALRFCAGQGYTKCVRRLLETTSVPGDILLIALRNAMHHESTAQLLLRQPFFAQIASDERLFIDAYTAYTNSSDEEDDLDYAQAATEYFAPLIRRSLDDRHSALVRDLIQTVFKFPIAVQIRVFQHLLMSGLFNLMDEFFFAVQDVEFPNAILQLIFELVFERPRTVKGLQPSSYSAAWLLFAKNNFQVTREQANRMMTFWVTNVIQANEKINPSELQWILTQPQFTQGLPVSVSSVELYDFGLNVFWTSKTDTTWTSLPKTNANTAEERVLLSLDTLQTLLS